MTSYRKITQHRPCDDDLVYLINFWHLDFNPSFFFAPFLVCGYPRGVIRSIYKSLCMEKGRFRVTFKTALVPTDFKFESVLFPSNNLWFCSRKILLIKNSTRSLLRPRKDSSSLVCLVRWVTKNLLFLKNTHASIIVPETTLVVPQNFPPFKYRLTKHSFVADKQTVCIGVETLLCWGKISHVDSCNGIIKYGWTDPLNGKAWRNEENMIDPWVEDQWLSRYDMPLQILHKLWWR